MNKSNLIPCLNPEKFALLAGNSVKEDLNIVNIVIIVFKNLIIIHRLLTDALEKETELFILC